VEISEARVGHTHSRRFLADKALIVDSLLVVRLLPVVNLHFFLSVPFQVVALRPESVAASSISLHLPDLKRSSQDCGLVS